MQPCFSFTDLAWYSDGFCFDNQKHDFLNSFSLEKNMCGPTDDLLFAEDLVVFVSRNHDIPFRSKIKVWRFRHELQTTFSRTIGDAVLKIMKEIESESRFLGRTLAKNLMSVARHIRGITVNYEQSFNALSFLVRCAWICGLSILYGASSFEVLEEALFLIANDLHKIPDTILIRDEIRFRTQLCAGDLLKCNQADFRLKISYESTRYLKIEANNVVYDSDSDDDLYV